MSESLRIPLRILGLVVFAGSLAAVALYVIAGPDQIADSMGRNCRRNDQLGPSEWCTWQDALNMMQVLPFLTLVGGALMLAMRPRQAGTPTLTLGRASAEEASGGSRLNGLRALATLAVIGIIAVNFVGVFVYRAGYTGVSVVGAGKDSVRETPRPDGSDRAKPETPERAPRGLAPGSLLRAGAFAKAMAELRRSAPAGARISGLRVTADRIDAEVVGRGRVVSLRKAWNADAAVVSTEAATDADTALTTFAALDTAAPQRVARAARGLDYLVLFDAAGLSWNAFLTDGKGPLRAAPDGRGLRSL